MPRSPVAVWLRPTKQMSGLRAGGTEMFHLPQDLSSSYSVHG